ncbi:MAG: hypothetical protein MJ232_00110 [archaeon]|nr:hypothetical protein [archaeon]
MKYQVLVPTHHKTIDECLDLTKKLKIAGNCLITNQVSEISEFVQSSTKILSINNIGVSNNRNNLLNYCEGDICICIDDDCPLVDNYEELINNAFKKYPDAEFILFNGIVTHENNRLIHNKKTKKVIRFKDVSYAGGPGLVFKKEAIKKYNLSYNTKVGFPNKIQIGEDSLFIKSIVDSKAEFIRSSDVLFVIQDDVDNSVYFKGVTEDFVISKGCIDKIVHPYLFWLLKYRYALKLKHWRNNKFSLRKLVTLLKEGSKLSKDII